METGKHAWTDLIVVGPGNDIYMLEAYGETYAYLNAHDRDQSAKCYADEGVLGRVYTLRTPREMSLGDVADLAKITPVDAHPSATVSIRGMGRHEGVFTA